VAPGFGERGIEGKIEAVRYAREHNIPFFGICLGLQCAVIEFARNVLKLKNANSTEVDKKAKHPVIDLMEDQKNIKNMGGTMRLGAYHCNLKRGTKAFATYGHAKINERHRHRYEFNSAYLDQFEQNGLIATGVNPETNLVEIMELKDHPWFIGTQFHPELKSTVLNPHPLFVRFVRAAITHRNKVI
jgi:CTP synthase